MANEPTQKSLILQNDQSQKTKDKDSSKKFQDPKDKIIEEYK